MLQLFQVPIRHPAVTMANFVYRTKIDECQIRLFILDKSGGLGDRLVIPVWIGGAIPEIGIVDVSRSGQVA